MLFFLFFISLHYTYLENNKETPGELPSLAQKEVNWGKKEGKFDFDLLTLGFTRSFCLWFLSSPAH